MRDQTPMVQGVSSVLKIPMKGPYRITEVESRNVTLQDIESGKIYHSHVELIRPLELKEFKLLLNKKWDLNSHLSKTAAGVETRSNFDIPIAEKTKTQVLQQDKEEEEREDSLELENLFYENTEPKPQLEPQIQPMDIPQKILPFQELLPAPLDAVSSRTRSRGTAILTNIENSPTSAGANTNIDEIAVEAETYTANANFNSYRVYEDVSKSYLQTLKEKLKNKVFFSAK